MMRFLPVLVLLLFLTHCASTEGIKTSRYKKNHTIIAEGEDLNPHIGSKIQVVGEVSDTQRPSIKEDWLTVLGLEHARGKRVHVWGELIQKEEVILSPAGNRATAVEPGGFYLENIGYSLVE